ncbi:ANTAR domain-containing response regulator [Psychromarinibacter halotolerans]|uniref:ANTAR domain-containing response regulator n=1 Tax=Psychromarinibacter halotolerans TaxID=1775175 RepID=A0ABV7GY80_9RHOB|nr:ANTAR domain-containing protein [Psychromarinibacter halotolerans]MAQ86584.1 two-component system response regulator [Maritimibacter sp.]MAS53026.1 two-component system response regulator [Pimelobacter sp.]MDF0598327.1 ANTAR domain-containing protein [Psychromarinibacter halotolerans]|tara:strand:- start:331 stop:936 length:606 start_codon:yes stop_codon:yes gene_type:complete
MSSVPKAADRGLSIVIVETDRDRAMLIVDSLRDAGDFEIHVIAEVTGLARHIKQHNPDVVLIDIENPSRDMLEELALASGPLDRPVAMFVDKSAEGLTDAAIEAGVSAYVVDGMKPDRLKPILDAAVARFRMFQRIRMELAETKRALEERKVIDRAKGMLMKAKGLTEEEAYALLRKTAMDQGRKVADVAQALVTAAGLLS